MIKDRDELVEMMVDAFEASRDSGTYYWTDVLSEVLDAMQAVGVVLVPEKATEEMVHAALNEIWQGTETYTRHQITAAIAAAPYRRKE